jgi:hypothetical protein
VGGKVGVTSRSGEAAAFGSGWNVKKNPRRKRKGGDWGERGRRKEREEKKEGKEEV